MPIIILGILIYLGFTLYSKSYFSLQPEGTRYKSSVDKITSYFKQTSPELVQFDEEELSLLSGNVAKMKKNLFFVSTPEEGILTSIYHEPFVAFSRQWHHPGKKLGVIGIATHSDTFLYIMKKDHTDVFINDRPYGTFQPNGDLVAMKGKTTVGSYSAEEKSYLIKLENVPVAEIKMDITQQELPLRIIDVFDPLDSNKYKQVEILAFYLLGLSLH